MNIFSDSEEEEDNNPFAGTNHLYASGIAAVADGEDDFISKGTIDKEQYSDEKHLHTTILTDPHVAEQHDNEIDNEQQTNQGTPRLNSFGNDAVISGPQSEPYVSLTMSMANLEAGNDKKMDTTGILITEAGDFKDPWGKHAIGYVIKYDGKEVIRRYSEFDSLRQALIRLLPTVIIPPIPSKHPLIRYFLSPLAAESDSKIIEKRKRLLSSFLNNCNAVTEIRSQIVFSKFLDPEYSWQNVLKAPPITILPVHNLLAPPLNPTKPSPLHLLLPITKSLSRLDPLSHGGSTIDLEKQFAHLEGRLKKFRNHFEPFHRSLKQHRGHLHSLASLFAELGAYYNAFSLQDNVISNEATIVAIKLLSNAIEKIGHGFDVNYVCSEILIENLLTSIQEPISEILKLLEDSQRVITFRKLKQLQFQIIDRTIQKRELRIKTLKEAQFQMQRLQEALQRNADDSPTIAQALKHLESRENLDTGEDNRKNDQMETFPHSKDKNETHFQSRDQPVLSGKKSMSRKRNGRSKELEPHQLTEHERQEEIRKLNKEIDKLNDCFKLITKDMDEVNTSTLNTLTFLIEHIEKKLSFMLKSFTKFIVSWLSECLKAWKNARLIVNSMEL